MKKLFLAVLSVCVCCAFGVGCSQESTATKKVEIKTPGGSTTVTTKQDVKKTGDHKDE